MSIQLLRGFRDFYPEDQAKINYVQTKIAQVCTLFGYEEFEGPALESFDLYAAKSSDEIVNEQAFVFADRGGEKITLRPELTPTLARMVANRQQQLTFPLRWWSFGRFWRYERPQKGRAREFYQWNCDLIGPDSAIADAELLEIIITFLQSLGLTKDDCVIEISDRQFVNNMLKEKGIEEAKIPAVFRYLDKAAKLTEEEAAEYATKLSLSEEDQESIQALMNESTNWQGSERMQQLSQLLQQKNLQDWIQPSVSLVRGFTYYTGLVFEVSDRAKQYRALLGGGRYSNLVESVGGEPVSGIGFGMGDMVLLNFLDEKGLLPQFTNPIQICVIGFNQQTAEYAQSITSELRQANFSTVFYESTDGPGKGLKFANQKQIPFALLIGEDEVTNKTITLKDLQTGDQETISQGSIIELLKSKI